MVNQKKVCFRICWESMGRMFVLGFARQKRIFMKLLFMTGEQVTGIRAGMTLSPLSKLLFDVNI